jgi:FkbM family methyltransferase
MRDERSFRVITNIAYDGLSFRCHENPTMNSPVSIFIVMMRSVYRSTRRQKSCDDARARGGLNTLGEAILPNSKAPASTVDAFMRHHNIPRVDVMKVDLLGAELMVFRGARGLLERADAPLILYNCEGVLTRGFGYHPVEILWLLESFGYTLFVLNGKTGEISELQADYRYDSITIAAKPSHAAYAQLRARLK